MLIGDLMLISTLTKDLNNLPKLVTEFIPHVCNVTDLMDENPNLYNTDMRLWILWQQSGGMSKYFKVYPTAYANNKNIIDGYLSEARICMMNMLIQIDLFCIANKWDVDKLRYEGYQHLVDKITEVKANGGNII